MNYATFWQRFAAGWVDFFVLVPFVVLHGLAESVSKPLAMVLVVPMNSLFAAYTIYFHGRTGQTLGKRVMGIRVISVSGNAIGWREAWLRSSVDLLFAALGIVSLFAALANIPDAEYYGVGWLERNRNLQSYQPIWTTWEIVAAHIWIWSEVVVMLFNKRRRALHDFIAGTVVIRDRWTSVSP